MKIQPSSYYLIFILIVTGIAVGISLSFGSFTATLLPAIAGSTVFLLAAIQLLKELRTREKQQKAADEQQMTREDRINLLGWLLGFPIAVYLVGFQIIMPLSIFLFLKLRGRSWLIAIVVAAATTILLYGIFQFALKIDLWNGLLFQLLS